MELLTLLIPLFSTVILAVLGIIGGRKLANAQAALLKAQVQLTLDQSSSEESTTIKTLSESTKLQIEVYTNLIVKPLRERLEEVSQDLILARSNLKIVQEKLDKAVEELLISKTADEVIHQELFSVKALLKQLEDSLDYLIEQVKKTFPVETSRALEIRKKGL